MLIVSGFGPEHEVERRVARLSGAAPSSDWRETEVHFVECADFSQMAGTVVDETGPHQGHLPIQTCRRRGGHCEGRDTVAQHLRSVDRIAYVGSSVRPITIRVE